MGWTSGTIGILGRTPNSPCAGHPQAPGEHGAEQSPTHLVLRAVGVVLALLHGCGHLVHGGHEDAAGLAQALVGVDALGAINLEDWKCWILEMRGF